jgi:AcrR family transcriptional regulator
MTSAPTYRAADMVMTPWGEAEDLRSQMLRPVRGASRQEVDRSQRERLMAAAVAIASERGYEAMNVSDLVALSGVSRGDFYRHFSDKRDCFLATMFECMKRLTSAVVDSVEEEGVPLTAVLDAVLAQPAAARICLGEAYAAGPEASALLERVAVKFEDVAFAALAKRHGAPVPRPVCRGIIGGLRTVVETRLRRRTEPELRDLADDLFGWSVAYPPPTRPLRRRRVTGRGGATEKSGERHLPSSDPGARIVEAATRVIAKEGFPATTIKGVAEAAQVSLATLYRTFAGKEEILDAILDAGISNLAGRVGPVVRRARSWTQGIQLGSEAMLAFLASEPDFARVVSAEVHAAGAQALERRQDWIDRALPHLVPAPGESTAMPAVAAEAIAGAVMTLIEHHVRSKGPESLRDLAPTVIYMVLAPSVEVERASAAAAGRNSH